MAREITNRHSRTHNLIITEIEFKEIVKDMFNFLEQNDSLDFTDKVDEFKEERVRDGDAGMSKDDVELSTDEMYTLVNEHIKEYINGK